MTLRGLPGNTGSSKRGYKWVYYAVAAISMIFTYHWMFQLDTVSKVTSDAISSTKSLVHSGDGIHSNLRNIYDELLPVTADQFISPEGKTYALKDEPVFKKPLGKDVLILDVETRPLDGEGKILNRKPLNLNTALFDTMSRLGHYMYARTHGYDYKLVQPAEADLIGSYLKVPVVRDLLHNYKIVVFMDGDTMFPYPHIPIEWLLNLWGVKNNTLIAMPEDVDEPWSYESRGNLILNSGFIVAQQSDRTHELLDAWATCPKETRYPGCAAFRETWPLEQFTFSNWVRYDFNRTDEVVAIPCTLAMGYPGAPEGGGICHGELMTHWTTSKDSTSAAVQKSVMQYVMREVHRQFHREYDDVVLN